MREKRGIVLAGVLLLGLIAAGCIALLYGSRNRSGDGQSQKKIGAVYMTMNNPYFAVVNNQIEAVAASRKDVVITRDSALDAEMQNRQIKELIKENVDISPFSPGKIDMSALSGGVYSIKLKSDKVEINSTIVKI